MAKQSETSRQRRARRNRAQRAALQARKEAAATPREQRVASAPAAEPSAGRRTRGDRAAAARSGGRSEASSGGARQALAEGRLGQVPVDVDALEGSFLAKVVRVPGGMQVLMAAVLVVVLTVLGSVMATIPEEGAERGSEATRTVFEVYGAAALLFLLPPVILVGNALFFSLHPKRRRMWMVSGAMLGIFSLIMLMTQFIFPAGFLAYAALRSKRIEEGSARRPRASAVDDPVDEADDADDLDDDEAVVDESGPDEDTDRARS